MSSARLAPDNELRIEPDGNIVHEKSLVDARHIDLVGRAGGRDIQRFAPAGRRARPTLSMMKKFAVLAFVLQVLVLPLFAADAPQECSLCVGAVANLSSPPATVIPLVLQMRESDLATTPIDSLSAEQRAK